MPEDNSSPPGRTFASNISRLTLFLQSPDDTDDTIVHSQMTKEATLALTDKLVKTITIKETTMLWAVPMLVTYTEVYLEEALELLVSGAFANSTLPSEIVAEIAHKWIKGTIRSGDPCLWIKILNKFGVTGYPQELPVILKRIWDLRHAIIHSSTPETVQLPMIPLGNLISQVGNFVTITEAFVVKQTIASQASA
jgi:hypothetical protein